MAINKNSIVGPVNVKNFFVKKDSFWEKKGEKYNISLFKKIAKEVPAYGNFLREEGLSIGEIKNWEDFKKIPAISKDNYLRKNILEDLCWGGTLKQPIVYTSTSGSTGKPFYFPRNDLVDKQSTLMHELFLFYRQKDIKKNTLVLNCFGMGVWIGGIITYQAFKNLTLKGYPLSVISPGINKKEIFDALKELAPNYEEVIICGYPPFVKGIVDECGDYGINLKGLNLRIIFAAEAFSEKFRDYICEKTNIKNPYLDTMNIYGSADIGTMAEETPLSILIRKLALENNKIFKDIFGGVERLPTLVQFNPLFVNFIEQNKEVVCTGNSTLPLIKYAIGDHGGVLTYKQIIKIFKDNGIDLNKELIKRGLLDNVLKWPFVYIYERKDLSTKLYGAIIYPEHIKEALHHPEITDYLTGKFSMITKFDDGHNQFLEINLELKKNVNHDDKLKKIVREEVVNSLLEKNAEYKNNASEMPNLVEPRFVFWDYEHPEHFSPNGKQKWVKNLNILEYEK